MGKKILVVDNHPMMLKFMTHLLEKEGHDVLTAPNGLAALDLLHTETPEVIFTDLIMPNIDGEKLCRIIRKMPRLKDTYVVVFSAIAAEQEVDFEEFGANACIAKGPLNNMTQHVLSALALMNRQAAVSPARKTLGTEEVYPRHITKELLSLKKHFEVILERMSEGILEINEEARILFANPSAVTIIGISEEKLLAANFMDLFEDPDLQRIRDLMKKADSLSGTIPDENPVWLKGKQISLSMYPIANKKQNDRIIILRDITERKRMEAQLFQAQKMEAIGTLAGGIAHDFNNLLMVIQGNTSLMLLDTPPAHPNFEMLKTIEKKVKSGSRLTGQLLGYASKGRYEIKPIRLNQLVEETAEAFGRTQKSILFHYGLAQDLFLIDGDPGQIEQLLMNLLVNAADAMPLGGDITLKTVNISHREIREKVYRPRPRDYVLLTVTDTGAGMDSKVLERIFDPFFTTKKFGKGTGLGLAMVYGIVKGHGGYIDVESQEGKGTTFQVYLPAAKRRVEETEEGPETIQRGTETILIIDDEALVMEVGQKLLTFMGYQVLAAKEGEGALEIYRARRNEIDLVILDLVMPRMEGGEVFRRLRQISPEVKVLISSGYSIDGKAAQILDEGACGFIQKPFDMKQLSQTLRTILDEKDHKDSSE
jgi:PAS domain S-box-containing protein